MVVNLAASDRRPPAQSPSRGGLRDDLEFLRTLLAKGGPSPCDYPALQEWFGGVHARTTSGELSSNDLRALREGLGEAVSPGSLQGLAIDQPHGYPGDFEMIDKIYVRYLSPNPRLMLWDAFFQSQPASKAVRNRKSYFHCLLDNQYALRRPLRVLKLACGPGRSMFEWLSAHKDADLTFDCIELDPNAIRYAAALNEEFSSKIAFQQRNAVRFHPQRQYDLIWAAGLFDYFPDRIFQSVLRRLLPAVANEGELVIGNFSTTNPSRGYMEFGGWSLHHRTPSALTSLARCSGARPRPCALVPRPKE